MGRKPNMIPSTCEKVHEVGRGVCVCVYMWYAFGCTWNMHEQILKYLTHIYIDIYK
jgi:hypothetical protein